MTFRKLTDIDLDMMDYDMVSTLTLASGWDKAESTTKFKDVVKAVMKLNPVLTGRLKNTKDCGIGVEQGVFDVDDVVNVMQFPTTKTFQVPVSASDKVEVMQELASQFKPVVKSGQTLLKEGWCVFEVSILLLPLDFVCFKIGISHVIADGPTYFKVVEQISNMWNSNKPGFLLDWAPLPEAYPYEKSPSALHFVDKAKLFVTVASVVLQSWMQKITKGGKTAKCVAVNRSVCATEKVGANDGSCKFLSTNDVVTAALADQSSAGKVFMAANLRGKQGQHPSLTPYTAGNYLAALLFHKTCMSMNPSVIRRRLEDSDTWSKRPKHFYLQIVRRKFLENHTFCIVTNWASNMACVHGSGLDLVAQMPSMSIDGDVPDAAIIFRLDQSGTLAICHNFHNGNHHHMFSPSKP